MARSYNTGVSEKAPISKADKQHKRVWLETKVQTSHLLQLLQSDTEAFPSQDAQPALGLTRDLLQLDLPKTSPLIGFQEASQSAARNTSPPFFWCGKALYFFHIKRGVRNVDQLVNWQLCFHAQLSQLQQRGEVSASPATLSPHSWTDSEMLELFHRHQLIFHLSIVASDSHLAYFLRQHFSLACKTFPAQSEVCCCRRTTTNPFIFLDLLFVNWLN